MFSSSSSSNRNRNSNSNSNHYHYYYGYDCYHCLSELRQMLKPSQMPDAYVNTIFGGLDVDAGGAQRVNCMCTCICMYIYIYMYLYTYRQTNHI